METSLGLSVQEVADRLKVSKGSIYNLIWKNEIKFYRVGRKIRFTEEDVKDYISTSRVGGSIESPAEKPGGFVLCGQDVILDVLSNYLRLQGVQALRAYIGSYAGLTALYHTEVDVTAAHIWDSDTDQYNIPFVRRLLPGIPTVILHVTCRMQGFYVAKGNPKGIRAWEDFAREDISMINREPGAGSRILLDENLRLRGIPSREVRGYDREAGSHLSVASAVSAGRADLGVGTEKIACQVDTIDFIPIKKERYDLVFRKEKMETREIQTLLGIVRSDSFRDELIHVGGYDTTDMGKIVGETR
jgi:putative molybdopterin biosynthesis protein